MLSDSSEIIYRILISILLVFIALITSIGNLIVLLAFYCDNKLRSINDYFILNLAMADFLVGFFCIPFYIPFSIKRIWTFGRVFCQIWVTVDDVSTMASVINILAITVNCYWSIAYPLSYRKYIKLNIVYLAMGSIWFISFINFVPGIWLLSLFDSRYENRLDCSGDYNRSFLYMLIAQLNYFICPFMLLCILNILILCNIWKRSRKMSRLMSFQIKKKNLSSTKINDFIQETSPNLNSHQILREKEKSLSNYQETITHLTSVNQRYSLINQNKYETIQYANRSTNPNCHLNVKCLQSVNDSIVVQSMKEEINERRRRAQHHSRIVRDRKAARSLFILVIVFLIFLFPYVICSTATTAGFNVSSTIFEISFWLLWLNSTCNPFLYPFIQIKYRRAYAKLFHSCFKTQTHL